MLYVYLRSVRYLHTKQNMSNKVSERSIKFHKDIVYLRSVRYTYQYMKNKLSHHFWHKDTSESNLLCLGK